MRSPSNETKREKMLRKEEAEKLEKALKEKNEALKEKNELEKQLKNLLNQNEEHELELEHDRVLQRQQEMEHPFVSPIQNNLRYTFFFDQKYSSGNLKPVFLGVT